MADEVLLVKKESLESVADAIREKSGSSEKLEFPEGFVGALNNIPIEEDWTNATKWMSSVDVPKTAGSLPETVILDGSNLGATKWFNLPAGWTTDYGYRHVIVRNSNKNPITLQGVFQNYYPSRAEACTCTFEDGVILANVLYSMQYVGYNSNNPFPKIYGEIDLSQLTDDYNPDFRFRASHIEFKSNSCSLLSKFNFNNNTAESMFDTTGADDSTMVSIANSLKDGIVGTITLPTNGKTRFENITGVNDTSRGYNLFIQNESGNLTLTQFITDIKGWTLA